jgi:hypothetical protein
MNRRHDVTDDQLLLIDILNTMYNDNLRQITHLTNSNQEIRNIIIQMLNNNTNTHSRNNNIRNNLTSINQNTNNPRTNNSRTNNPRTNNSRSNNLFDYYSISFFDTNGETNNVNFTQNNPYTQLLRSFLDPIEIYPTQSQIESATRRVRYCDIVSPTNTSCPISLTNFDDNDMVTVIRHCGHIFNTNELNRWFTSHCNCPVCRYDIRDYNLNSSSVFSRVNQDASSNISSQNYNSQMSSQSNSEINNTSHLEGSVNPNEIINILNSRDASGNNIISTEQLRNITQQISNISQQFLNGNNL